MAYVFRLCGALAENNKHDTVTCFKFESLPAFCRKELYKIYTEYFKMFCVAFLNGVVVLCRQSAEPHTWIAEEKL